MLVTETDARKLWCSFARVVDSINEQAGVNRRNGMKDQHFPDPKCIASECMSWRWSDWRKEEIPAGGYDQQETEKLTKMGFCGLAGKPA